MKTETTLLSNPNLVLAKFQQSSTTVATVLVSKKPELRDEQLMNPGVIMYLYSFTFSLLLGTE